MSDMTRKQIELKPCPFCGEPPVEMGWGGVCCRHGHTGQLAVETWNRRALRSAELQPVTRPDDGLVEELLAQAKCERDSSEMYGSEALADLLERAARALGDER